MAEKTFIADKATQDAIKQDTEFLKGQFPIQGGTDWSRYLPYRMYNNALGVIGSLDSLETVLEIDGAGFIDYLEVSAGVGILGSKGKILITLDDDIYVDMTLENPGSTNRHNTFTYEHYTTIPTAIIARNFPIIESVINNTSLSRQITTAHLPLFFNEKLKIEIFSSLSTSTRIDFLGGVQK